MQQCINDNYLVCEGKVISSSIVHINIFLIEIFLIKLFKQMWH